MRIPTSVTLLTCVAVGVLFLQTCRGADYAICNTTAEVVFVLDTSSSVGADNFEQMKILTQNVTVRLKSEYEQINVTVITFSNEAKVEFALDASADIKDVLKAEANITYSHGGTQTHKALQLVYQSAFHGDVISPKIVILITDGSSIEPEMTREAARLVKESGITIFVVAVGDDLNPHEIEAISSEPHEKYLYHLENFSSLSSLVNVFHTEDCIPNPATTLERTPTTVTLHTQTATSFKTTLPHPVTIVQRTPSPHLEPITTNQPTAQSSFATNYTETLHPSLVSSQSPTGNVAEVSGKTPNPMATRKSTYDIHLTSEAPDVENTLPVTTLSLTSTTNTPPTELSATDMQTTQERQTTNEPIAPPTQEIVLTKTTELPIETTFELTTEIREPNKQTTQRFTRHTRPDTYTVRNTPTPSDEPTTTTFMLTTSAEGKLTTYDGFTTDSSLTSRSTYETTLPTTTTTEPELTMAEQTDIVTDVHSTMETKEVTNEPDLQTTVVITDLQTTTARISTTGEHRVQTRSEHTITESEGPTTVESTTTPEVSTAVTPAISTETDVAITSEITSKVTPTYVTETYATNESTIQITRPTDVTTTTELELKTTTKLLKSNQTTYSNTIPHAMTAKEYSTESITTPLTPDVLTTTEFTNTIETTEEVTEGQTILESISSTQEAVKVTRTDTTNTTTKRQESTPHYHGTRQTTTEIMQPVTLKLISPETTTMRSEPETIETATMTHEPETLPTTTMTPESKTFPTITMTTVRETIETSTMTHEPETLPTTITKPEPETLPTTIAKLEPETLSTTIKTPEPETLPTTIAKYEPETLPTTIKTPEPETIPTTITTPQPNTHTTVTMAPALETIETNIMTHVPEANPTSMTTQTTDTLPTTTMTPEPEIISHDQTTEASTPLEERSTGTDYITTTTPAETTTTIPPTTTTASCIAKLADVVFVVDSSGSIGDENFQKVKEFIKDVVQTFDIDSKYTRVGLIGFSTSPSIEFKLHEHDNITELLEAIDNITYTGGGTRTSEALELMRIEGFDRERPLAPDIAIVITDGLSRYPPITQKQAGLAKADGVTLFSIGIGNQTSGEELRAIASDPRYVFQVGDFETLFKAHLDNVVAHTTCGVILPEEYHTRAPTTSTTTPAGCVDIDAQCASYPRDSCSDYAPWAMKNCARKCGFCPDFPIVEPPCEDRETDCFQYGTSMCSSISQYEWVDTHCRLFCGFCGNKTDGTLTSPSSTTASTPAVTTEAGCVDDLATHCDRLEPGFCTKPAYSGYARSHCARFCGFCFVYEVVTSVIVNNVQCPAWQLPVDCTLDYRPGSCCPLPKCPDDVRLTVQRH